MRFCVETDIQGVDKIPLHIIHPIDVLNRLCNRLPGLAMRIIPHACIPAVGIWSHSKRHTPVNHRVTRIVSERLLMGGDGLWKIVTPGQSKPLVKKLLCDIGFCRDRPGIRTRTFYQNGPCFSFGRFG